MANRAQRRKQERLANWEKQKQQLELTNKALNIDFSKPYTTRGKNEMDFKERVKQKMEYQQKWTDKGLEFG